MDRFLRRATPLVLLVLAGLAWFETWLPGHQVIAKNFGDDAVLRFVTGFLCIYMVMLVLERQRMEQTFKQVLLAFREFRGGAPGAKPGPDARDAQREAVQILVGALDSPDESVRKTSAVHLKRLTGLDLGEDAAAWRRWLAAQDPAPGGSERPGSG